MNRKTLITTLALILLVSIPFLLGAICVPGEDGPPDPNAPGAVYFHIKYPSGLGSGITVNLHVIWYGELISQTGTSGSTLPFTSDKNYSGTTDINGEVIFSQSVTNLMPGTWRFQATVPGAPYWSTDCQQNVLADKTIYVNFTCWKVGCTTGLSYP